MRVGEGRHNTTEIAIRLVWIQRLCTETTNKFYVGRLHSSGVLNLFDTSTHQDFRNCPQSSQTNHRPQRKSHTLARLINMSRAWNWRNITQRNHSPQEKEAITITQFSDMHDCDSVRFQGCQHFSHFSSAHINYCTCFRFVARVCCLHICSCYILVRGEWPNKRVPNVAKNHEFN